MEPGGPAQGLKPKVASVGKAILFPVAVEALGKNGNNLSSEVWWSPHHPFRSSLTGQSAQALADAYQQSTGKGTKYDIVITDNRAAPQIPVAGQMQPIA